MDSEIEYGSEPFNKRSLASGKSYYDYSRKEGPEGANNQGNVKEFFR